MNIERYAAFTNGNQGGNPAGVVISDALPDASAMQGIAAEVGYSETVFAAPEDGAWRVRYFAPQIEIPFCGHATIALGSALALRHGSGRFDLRINDGDVAVEGTPESAVLQSMPATHQAADPAYLRQCMELFGFESADLDRDIPPAIINAGSNHMLLALSSRATLAAMRYDLESGRDVMAAHRLATIMLVHRETDRLYYARNPFASGGVYEDPATGSAAAAFAGYLRAQDAEPGVRIEIRQGDDMGVPTRLIAEIPGQLNAPVRVSGTVRKIAG